MSEVPLHGSSTGGVFSKFCVSPLFERGGGVVGAVQKSIFKRFCQLLAINASTLAPRTRCLQPQPSSINPPRTPAETHRRREMGALPGVVGGRSR